MITKKARIWIGVTILIVIGFNYTLIGFPLMQRSDSLIKESRIILQKQAKSKKLALTTRENYLLDLYRKERISTQRGLLILNCIAASLAIGTISWIIFGIWAHRKEPQTGLYSVQDKL